MKLYYSKTCCWYTIGLPVVTVLQNKKRLSSEEMKVTILFCSSMMFASFFKCLKQCLIWIVSFSNSFDDIRYLYFIPPVIWIEQTPVLLILFRVWKTNFSFFFPLWKISKVCTFSYKDFEYVFKHHPFWLSNVDCM